MQKNTQKILFIPLTGELWSDIEGFEGLYKISTFGRVMSTLPSRNRKVTNELIILKPTNRRAYSCVSLHKNRLVKQCLVHRLVALAFIPNPNQKPTVNHKDGVKTNNHVSNLEWATYPEQLNHAYKTGLAVASKHMAGKLGALNFRSKPIVQLSMNNDFVAHYASATEAARILGLPQTGISAACLGKRAFSKGYKWKFKSEYTKIAS